MMMLNKTTRHDHDKEPNFQSTQQQVMPIHRLLSEPTAIQGVVGNPRTVNDHSFYHHQQQQQPPSRFVAVNRQGEQQQKQKGGYSYNNNGNNYHLPTTAPIVAKPIEKGDFNDLFSCYDDSKQLVVQSPDKTATPTVVRMVVKNYGSDETIVTLRFFPPPFLFISHSILSLSSLGVNHQMV
jgi:hypothetical protein